MFPSFEGIFIGAFGGALGAFSAPLRRPLARRPGAIAFIAGITTALIGLSFSG